MIDKIEVYIRNEEVVVGQTMIGRPIADHYCTAKDTLKTEKVMSEADRRVLEIVNEVAKEKGLRIEVCDVSSFRGAMKGKSRGVKETPTIVIGDVKIEGIPDRQQILSLLKE